MIDENRLKNVKEIDLKKYLEDHGARFTYKKNNYISCCIFHQEKTPSLKVYYSKYNEFRFKCYGCGVYGTIIDACQLINKVNFPRAVELLEEYNNTGTINNKIEKKVISACKKNNQEADIKREKRIKALNNNARPIDEDVKQYLKDRNLLNIVTLINKKNFHLKIKMNEFKDNKTILYMFTKHNLIIQKNIKVDPATNKRFVLNAGNSKPIPLILFPGDNEIFIVEGIEDALTILDLNKNVIVLNGVSNSKKLLEILKNKRDWAQDKEFKLLLDNDQAGREHQHFLQVELSKLNYKVAVSELFNILEETNFKDINDYYRLTKKAN